MMELGKKKRGILTLAIAAVLTGIYFVIAARYIHMVYAVIDDVTMKNIVSGVMSGTPDAHMVCSKYVLGVVLSTLYRLIPGIDWYGCMMLACILGCLILVLHRGLREEKSLFSAVSYGAVVFLLFTCVGLKHLMSFQFTVTPSITGGTALFLYYNLPGGGEESGRKNLLEYAVIVLLLWVTFCIRDDVFLMVLPMLGVLWWHRSRKGQWRKQWRFPAALAVGILLIQLVELIAYASPEWKAYLDFYDNRVSVYDYYGVPPYEEHEEFYESIGLKEYDVRNLERYSLYFVDGIQEEKMAQIAAYAKETYEASHPFAERVWHGIQTAWQGMTDPEQNPLNLCVLTAFFLVLALAFYRKGKGLLLLAAITGIELLLWLYLGYRGRMPVRVGTAMYFVYFFVLAALVFEGMKTAPVFWKGKAALRLAGTLAVLVVLFAAARKEAIHVFQLNFDKYSENLHIEILNDYYKQHGENIYFSVTATTTSFTENFKIRKHFEKSNGMTLGDWDTFTPVMEKKLSDYGITDVPGAMAESDHIYMVTTYKPDSIEAYYQERYDNLEIEIVEYVPCIDFEYIIFQFQAE